MNLNKVYLIGRLTADPEMRSTSSGQNVTSLRMATNRVWSDSAGGGKKEATEFHSIVAWGRLGEIANQYLKKGALVMIEGRIQTRSWTDQNNNKRYMTEIVAENLQMGPRTSGSSYGESGGGYSPKVSSKVASPKEDDIPIIDEDEAVSSGVDEDEVKVNEKDIPF